MFFIKKSLCKLGSIEISFDLLAFVPNILRSFIAKPKRERGKQKKGPK